MKLPLARTENIVVQTAGKELLIYDLKTHKAYCLNETSKIVFEACNGQNSIEELKLNFNFTEEIILLSLDELKANDLIENDPLPMANFTGLTRREAIRKAGLSSMIALPVISNLIAPAAVMAQSGGGAACVNPGGLPDGAVSNATTPNTGSSRNIGICLQKAVDQCCSGGTDGGRVNFDNSGDPVTCSVICGNVPLTF